MANQAETGNIGHAVHSIFAIADKFRGLLVQRRHGLNRSVNPCLVSHFFFDRGGNHSGAQRFRQDESVAGLRSTIGKNFFRMHESSHGIPELEFFVANAVSSDHGAASLDHFR
jgi:hypothetical protein